MTSSNYLIIGLLTKEMNMKYLKDSIQYTRIVKFYMFGGFVKVNLLFNGTNFPLLSKQTE